MAISGKIQSHLWWDTPMKVWAAIGPLVMAVGLSDKVKYPLNKRPLLLKDHLFYSIEEGFWLQLWLYYFSIQRGWSLMDFFHTINHCWYFLSASNKFLSLFRHSHFYDLDCWFQWFNIVYYASPSCSVSSKSVFCVTAGLGISTKATIMCSPSSPPSHESNSRFLALSLAELSYLCM